METMKAVTEFYSTCDEDSRLTGKHGSVEFLSTMRYPEKHFSGILSEFGKGDIAAVAHHIPDIFRKL